MLPRYDENHQLTAVLKSQAVKLLDATSVAGRSVSIEFFNPDQTPKGRIDLVTATIDQETGLISTRDPVEIKSDRMNATGSGLYYSFSNNEGFLLGPATTSIQAPTETTMITPLSPLRATALLGMSLLAPPLSAAPPNPITAEEIAAIQADVTSRAPTANAARAAARTSLEARLADAGAASQAAATFLVQAGLPPVAPDATPPPAKPLEVKPGPADTVINCEGGMYFDPDEGVLVYLKNVTVKDPRFDLSGADELKIFFGKKPAKEPKDSKEPKDPKDKPETGKAKDGFGGNIGANFGDVERIVANGAVLLNQKKAAAGKEPIQASGAIFSYDLKADQIIIKGGYPWVVQGATFLRAKEPNLILRISPDAGSFITEGHWEMGGNIEQKKK